MQAPLYFSLMNDIKQTGDKAGSLRKGVVSSVVPYATFADVIDLMIWMADENRTHPGHEAYGIVATRFHPCDQRHVSYRNMRPHVDGTHHLPRPKTTTSNSQAGLNPRIGGVVS